MNQLNSSRSTVYKSFKFLEPDGTDKVIILVNIKYECVFVNENYNIID